VDDEVRERDVKFARKICLPTEDNTPLPSWTLYADIHRERIRAHAKHDRNGDSMERKTYDDGAWLSVLGEEFGEVCRVLCDSRHHGEYDGGMATKLREELVQLGAMVAAWIDAVDFTEEVTHV